MGDPVFLEGTVFEQGEAVVEHGVDYVAGGDKGMSDTFGVGGHHRVDDVEAIGEVLGVSSEEGFPEGGFEGGFGGGGGGDGSGEVVGGEAGADVLVGNGGGVFGDEPLFDSVALIGVAVLREDGVDEGLEGDWAEQIFSFR